MKIVKRGRYTDILKTYEAAHGTSAKRRTVIAWLRATEPNHPNLKRIARPRRIKTNEQRRQRKQRRLEAAQKFYDEKLRPNINDNEIDADAMWTLMKEAYSILDDHEAEMALEVARRAGNSQGLRTTR
jgi:hypothetical protein